MRSGKKEKQSKKYYIPIAVGVAFLVLLFAGSIIYLVSISRVPKISVDEPMEMTQEETGPQSSVVLEKSEREVLPPKGIEPRDNYIHIEASPEDEVYKDIEDQTPLKLKDMSESLKKLASYIKETQGYEQAGTAFVTTYAESEVAFVRMDDVYWRLKYNPNTKQYIADGELKDIVYYRADEWEKAYREHTYDIDGVGAEIAISLINMVMEDYPYNEYLGLEGTYTWDKQYTDPENITYNVVLANEKYTDHWIVDFKYDDYACIYRDITG